MRHARKRINPLVTLPWILIWVLVPAPLYIWAILALII